KLNKKLRFTFAGNTAMHMPELGYIKPGLEHISFPQSFANIPGVTRFGTNYMKNAMEDLGIPTVSDMISLLSDAGAHMYACRLTGEMMKFIEADLEGIEGVISATDFIEISEGAQIIFI
ncbi:MAG: DsrE/DsrF/DrsH-like family protein, partial [Eggerthellaceae bacterium]|nr:DsrE/DsrF/DrsH-like family protein [Eggerthellaceae bacterium]